MARGRLSVEAYAAGVQAGDRAVLARAITLVESQRADDQALARELVAALQTGDSRAGGALRVGITGSPGAGKSTLIEALGLHLVRDLGRRVAVLAVDPSSVRSGGSILGDKTRMQELAREPRAFIRPSPSLGELGGVARHTRETVLLCEAAGFDVVLVETVGVGQSEVMVAQLVDCFLVLMLAGAGDELQGIKRGILELADILAITKADGDNLAAAERARAEYALAMRLIRPKHAGWSVPVVTTSSVTGAGLAALWQTVERHREALQAGPAWQAQREAQHVHWLWRAIEAELMRRFAADPEVLARRPALEAAVRAGRLSPDHAAAELLAAFAGPAGR
ncbi:methylmalonyl Co-A mutase-associated GTPase MeaB [Nannocystis pusilla]|uniref:methylmalonyl Co-A mutase-associated GTPase MeaB n=1 Tax=Nannocystis pusilla TaxID=889268 RepID=UPI003B7F6A08